MWEILGGKKGEELPPNRRLHCSCLKREGCPKVSKWEEQKEDEDYLTHVALVSPAERDSCLLQICYFFLYCLPREYLGQGKQHRPCNMGKVLRRQIANHCKTEPAPERRTLPLPLSCPGQLPISPLLLLVVSTPSHSWPHMQGQSKDVIEKPAQGALVNICKRWRTTFWLLSHFRKQMNLWICLVLC